MCQKVIITGASGLLGKSLVEAAGDGAISLVGPGHGGLNLAEATVDQIGAAIPLDDPGHALLIHAAADLSETTGGLIINVQMAEAMATWARRVGIGFSVLVSSATVYAPFPWIHAGAPTGPTTLYGLGKLAAEYAWQAILPEDCYSIVRLTGLLGWSGRGFLNTLLRAAALGSPETLTVRNRGSQRNYFSGKTAARLLLHVARNRMAGTWLGAGLDITTAEAYVAALQALPGSKLRVEWGDGPDDSVVFHPSGVLLPQLRHLEEELAELWEDRPTWPASW
jgi:nucleoside-diphosphate-sugar epimerase